MNNEELIAQIQKLEAQNEQLLKALRNSKANPEEVMTRKEFEAEIKRVRSESMQIAFKKAEQQRIMSDNELKAEIEKIKSENAQLAKDTADARTALRRAKNPQPVERPSVKRMLSIVSGAFMSLRQVFEGFKLTRDGSMVPKPCGWELSMGSLKRRFRSLKDIWELLTQEDWFLSDIFPPAQRAPKKRCAPRLPFRHPVLIPRFPQFSQPIPAPG